MKNLYDKTYYEHGITSGVSGYENYRWLPELTIPMCQAIINYLNISKTDTVLDFGCAKGYIVRALRELQIQAYGVDISEYAISNADETIRKFVSNNEKDFNVEVFDWCISKDVLEHIDYDKIGNILNDIAKKCHNVFIVVPLGENGSYIVPEYENDITHIIRENKEWWENIVTTAGFQISKSSYVVKGIKENWAHYKDGNLFLSARSLLT